MRLLLLVLTCTIGCATVAPKTTTQAKSDPSFADLMGLLSGNTSVKESTKPCLVNGCTYNIHTEIDEDMAKDFSKWMDSAKANHVTMLNISINSPGGDVDSGYSIARNMEEFDRAGIKSACTVDGTGASMAFSVLQSCTYRYMTARSTLMTHQEKIGSKGGHMMSESQLQSLAAMVHADNLASAAHCVHRMKISIEEFLAKTDNKDWWMASDEALKVGAIDQIVKF